MGKVEIKRLEKGKGKRKREDQKGRVSKVMGSKGKKSPTDTQTDKKHFRVVSLQNKNLLDILIV